MGRGQTGVGAVRLLLISVDVGLARRSGIRLIRGIRLHIDNDMSFATECLVSAGTVAQIVLIATLRSTVGDVVGA